MFRCVTAIMCFALSAPAIAGPVLWQNVEAGMPAEKLKELYPEANGSPRVRWKKSGISLQNYPVGGCIADIQVATDRPMVDEMSVVKSVDLQGYGCAGATFNALVEKYGPPLDSETDRYSAPMPYNDKTRRAIWRDGEKTIRFKSERGGLVSLWYLKYALASDLGL